MNKTSDKIIADLVKYRVLILIIIFILTGIFAFFLTKIEVNNDPRNSIPPNLKELKIYQSLQKDFKSPRSILFLANFDSNLSLNEKVDSVSSWAKQFKKIDGVDNCIHLGTIKVPVSGGMFGLSSANIIPKRKKVSDDSLRTNIFANKEFTSAFISEDESVLGMMMLLDDSKNQYSIVSQVVKLKEKLNKSIPGKIVISGAPLYAYSINKSMKHDFGLLLPICLIVVFTLLFLVFRSMFYVISSLLAITIALIWTFGLMGLTGQEFSVVTAIIPVILFPIGVASSIHVFKTYEIKKYETNKTGLPLIQVTFEELMSPIFLSAITTFVGFGSFAISKISWTRNFGIFTSIGVALDLLLGIVLLPIVLSYYEKNIKSQNKKESSKKPPFFWTKYEEFVAGSYKWIILIVAILVIGITGFLKVHVEGNPIDMFPKDSDIRKSDALIAEHLGGTRFLWIELESKTGKINTIEKWQEIKDIENYLKNLDMVGGTSSLLPLITRVSTMLTNKEISNAGLRMILGSNSLLGKKFKKYIASWVTPNREKTKLVLICKNETGGTKFLNLSEKIKNYIAQNYPNWNVIVAGPPILNDAMTNVLIVTQKYSLIFAFVSVFLVLCVVFKSIKIGLFAVIPIILSTLFVYSMMGFMGVAINTVTVIIVNTCIGIGIDYAIHFVSGYLYARPNHDKSFDALMETARIKGSVIMFNTLIVGVGFLVLAFSSFPPIRHFGLFVFISMVSSSAFALIFLPVLFKLSGVDVNTKN